MHLHNCKCFQEHLRMLSQSLRALCKAPGGPGCIWKYIEALVMARRVSGRFACGFRTDLHFADVPNEPIPTYGHRVFVYNRILTERDETAKLWSEGHMQRDAWYRRLAWSNLPPGFLWWLWWSASTLKQPFRPDGHVFCLCSHSVLNSIQHCVSNKGENDWRDQKLKPLKNCPIC